jgi:Gnt-I system high-affinity gluconate transporter
MTILIIILAIALQVFLTVRKISPFLSLLTVAIISGLALGMSPSDLLKTIEKGIGSTLGGLALILVLGAILGKILEETGATESITSSLIGFFGVQNIQWAIMVTGFVIGLPLYYNAGFIILVPLVFSVTRKTGLPLLYLAIPMAASLSTTHCFLPPHPGPVFLVNAFKADLGLTLVYGIVIALPTAIIAGPVLGRWLKDIHVSIDFDKSDEAQKSYTSLPSKGLSFLIALLPVLLITSSVVAQMVLADGKILSIISFLGDANIALFISLVLAIYFLAYRKGIDNTKTMSWLNDAISGIAVILIIITAGGIFKQVLVDSGTAQYISGLSEQWHMPPLLFAWLITAVLRVVIGSATVAGITAAGVVSPLALSGVVSPELMVLAVGTGSVFGSHINDTGFWMFKEFFSLSLKETFMSWTLMETLISVLGLVGVLVLNGFV